MVITGVIETFAIVCRLYCFHWPWFSL